MTIRAVLELVTYGAAAVLLTAAALFPTPATNDPGSPLASRGAQLFAAKGCIGCHAHASVPGARMEVGPDLTAVASRAGSRVAGLTAEAYVRQSLRAPGAYVVGGYTTARMPDLQLTDVEIDALTAFLLRL